MEIDTEKLKRATSAVYDRLQDFADWVEGSPHEEQYAYSSEDLGYAVEVLEALHKDQAIVMPGRQLDERELAAVLAGLRQYQSNGRIDGILECEEIATGGGAFESLSREEIDVLCERLNCGGEA